MSPAGRSTSEVNSNALAALKKWRSQRASQDRVPAFVIFHDSALKEICMAAPKTVSELRRVPGMGDKKLGLYGKEILQVLGRADERPLE